MDEIEKLTKEVNQFKEKIEKDITDITISTIKELYDHKFEVKTDIQEGIRNSLMNTNERINTNKEDTNEKIKSTTEGLTSIITSRVRFVGITTVLLLTTLTWLWTFSYNTAKRGERFRDEIHSEFSLFKDEIKTYMHDFSLSQQKLAILMETHNKEHEKSQ